VTPVYLLRHAKSKAREKWTAPDDLRPLTKAGWRQAEALVELYADAEFTRLLSSPFVRCVQTLEPLARARSLPLETADELAEGAAALEATYELMRAVAVNGPAPLCTHGDVVQNVLDDLQRRSVPLEGPLELHKGSTWVLDLVDGEIARGRYLPPP
jgi:phosphohistidine phosphatase SixA